MMRRERGAGGVFIFVVLLLALIFLVAMFTFSRMSSAVDAQAQTKTNLATAAAALEQYASSTGRLPCPAKPDVDDGLAVPNAASVNCTYPQGVLPWSTIGMRRDDAYDAWGWKISYRVYSGNGGMTQDQGASMVNCDTVQALTQRQPVDGNKLCPVAHNTVDSDFITGKGLSVTDFGTTYDGTKSSGGAAYVLVSHGQTGLGAWTSAGTQRDTPTAQDEKNNMKDTGPFTLEAASGPDVGVNDNSHYDDVLLYRTVADLARKANLVARDWPDDVLAGVKFDQTTVQNALGSNPSGDLGVSSLSFAYSTVSGINSGGSTDLTYVSGGTTGLGAAGGGSNNLDSTGGDGIRIDLKQKAGQLAFTVNNFGYTSFLGVPIWIEQAEVRFYDNGTLVSPPGAVTKQACRSGSALASFSMNPGAPFDRVEIRSLSTTQAFGFSNASSFIISEFATCTSSAASCRTTLDTANPTSECP